ncbi:hypothetical protein [Salipaludibacillus aurantiacus]|uniref:Uncharacterized protein n=1 Tax=Salipaludibacillus aurantiacus TaxID=1601833 RepID=A0A1H9W4G6_9BACI|nr:hypothetical protein [Salipaludibacillus aurantiacus]SES28802.1 hypothetical protein SAMN05518684_11467 [Salipaludibacillus aurantiacus]
MSQVQNVTGETVIIPFKFEYYPLTKLALINCEKQPDEHYLGFEPQYIDEEKAGYRVIAYRHDGYVDVYDEPQLNDGNDDSFDVTGKGLCERLKTEITHTAFEKTDGRIYISFQFTDKYGRKIATNISEKSSKKTNGINLLAPIGSATENPSYLPVFFLYEFDFVRKHKTNIYVSIDGKEMIIDNFPWPLPKDFQWRYYTRYSDDCQIIEFAKASTGVLEEYTLDENGTITLGQIDCHFSADKKLKKMSLNRGTHPFTAEFKDGIPDIRKLSPDGNYEDTFSLKADPAMGTISGRYSIVRKGDKVHLELVPDRGWEAVPNSRFTKMMFSKKSVFCTWPKTYRYMQLIDVITLETSSRWERVKQ